MEEFDFDYHNWETKYPESGDVLQLGNSYTFTSGPTAPDQRIITLHFAEGMRYYRDPVTRDLSTTIQPKLNILRMEEFYKRHLRHKSFNYGHVVYGMLEVKFNKPFSVPKAVRGGQGQVEGFTVELLEIP